MTDNCCICGKKLFIDGKRQTDLCYGFYVVRKRILDNGNYADGTECGAYVCKSCFSRNNNDLIMKALWKGHERSKKIRKSQGED